MKLRDLLVGVPLTGGPLDPELEINSISTSAKDGERGVLCVELPDGEPELPSGAAVRVNGQCLHTDDPWLTLARLGANWYCSPGPGMTLTAVAGGGDSAIVVHLLQTVLEAMPRVRVGVITPDSAWINGVELPPGQREPGGLCVQRLLRRMADARCTHVILHLDDEALVRREYAGLRMTVTALTGPTGHREELRTLLAGSDMTVLNLDERGWEDYVSIIPDNTFTYSENKARADLTARNLRLFPGHVEFEAVAVGRIRRIHLPVPGGFAVYHGLCVLACGLCLGLRLERMAQVLRSAQGLRGRMEVLPVCAAYTVVMDQADTPETLERSLTSAREFTAGRLICLLGCPAQGEQEVLSQLGSVAEQLADNVILTGTDCRRQAAMSAIGDVMSGMGDWHRPCTVEPDRGRAIRSALERADPGDVILVTGSGVGRQSGDPDERDLIHSYIRRQHACREKGAWTGV